MSGQLSFYLRHDGEAAAARSVPVAKANLLVYPGKVMYNKLAYTSESALRETRLVAGCGSHDS